MSLNTESHYLFTHQVGSTQWHSAENQKAQGQGHEPVILFIPINAFLLFVCLFVFTLAERNTDSSSSNLITNINSQITYYTTYNKSISLNPSVYIYARVTEKTMKG